MKRITRVTPGGILLVSLMLTAFCSTATAQSPQTISYQGFLTNSDGNPVDRSVDLTFRLYTGFTDESAVWTESQAGVIVIDGVFSVELGREESLRAVAFDNILYLGVTVDGGAELRRIKLTASPYSLATRGVRFTTDESGNPSSVVVGINDLENDAALATISGGLDNTVAAVGATIGGGARNTAEGGYSVIGGGLDNSTNGIRPTVGGGEANAATGDWSTVPGGRRNEARGIYAFAGGHRARALHTGTFVWNDSSIPEDSLVSTGDHQFLIRAEGGVGIGTSTPEQALSVAGMIQSTTGGFMFPDGTVQETAASGGGGNNAVNAWELTGNSDITPENFLGTTINAPLEFRVNAVPALRLEPAVSEFDAPNLVAGHRANRVEMLRNEGGVPVGVAIGGGGGGGTLGEDNEEANIAANNYATIGGGRGNLVEGSGATIGGGQLNEALTSFDTVAGGRNNTAAGGGDGTSASVGGGNNNRAIGEAATVGGGEDNIASGSYSTVAGGSDNVASGRSSFAAGRRAEALHNGTFVWSDGEGSPFESTNENQFLIKAAGGVGIGTTAPDGALHVTHPEDEADLILGGAGVDALFGDDGIIRSDPALPSSDLILGANDAIGVLIGLESENDAEAEFIVADNQFSPVFRVDLTGSASTGNMTVEDELGEDVAPPPGGQYVDNVIYAWASVREDGSIEASFGCDITRTAGAGRYQVLFLRELPDGASAIVTPKTVEDPLLATVQVDETQADVAIMRIADNESGFIYVDNGFYIQVVGRP